MQSTNLPAAKSKYVEDQRLHFIALLQCLLKISHTKLLLCTWKPKQENANSLQCVHITLTPFSTPHYSSLQ